MYKLTLKNLNKRFLKQLPKLFSNFTDFIKP